jgi:hypothetical protein
MIAAFQHGDNTMTTFPTRRRLLLGTAATLVLPATSLRAQAYPSRPIT